MIAAVVTEITNPTWELLIVGGFAGLTLLAGFFQKRITPRLESLEDSKFDT